MTENIQRRAEKLFDSYHLLSGATKLSIEFLKYRQSLMDEIVKFRTEALDYVKQTPTKLCEKDIYFWAASSREEGSEEEYRTLEYVSMDILHTKVWDLLGMEDVPMDHKNDIGATCLFNGIQATIGDTTQRRKFAGRVVFGDLTVRHILFDINGTVVSLGFIDHEHANRDNQTWSGVAHELVFVREDCTLLRKGSDVWYQDSRYTISYIGSEEHLTPRGYVNKQKLTNIRLHLQPKDTTREIQVVITEEEVKDVSLRGHETSYGFTVDKQNRLMYKNGYVCDHLFKKTEANMICTTLGYEDVLYSKTGYEIPAANAWGRPHITMTDLKCKEMARGLDNDQCTWKSGEQMNQLETPWKYCGTQNGVQLNCVNGWVPNQNAARMEIDSKNVSCSRNEDSMAILIDTAHSCSGGEGDDASNFGHVQEVTVKGSVCVKLFRGDQLDCVVNEQAKAAWDFNNRGILEKFCYSESLSDNLLPFPEKIEMMPHDRPEPCSDDETKLMQAKLQLFREKGTVNETTVKLETCEDGKKFNLCEEDGIPQKLDDGISIDDASRETFNEFCAKACGECEVSNRKQYEVKVIAEANSFEYDFSGSIIPVEITIRLQGSSDVKRKFSVEEEEFAFDIDYHCGDKIQFIVEPEQPGYEHGRQDVECRMSMAEEAKGRMEDGKVLISGDIHVTFHCSNPPSAAPSVPPSFSPSFKPSAQPTLTPSVSPSGSPSFTQSALPTYFPSNTPTEIPSHNPLACADTVCPATVCGDGREPPKANRNDCCGDPSLCPADVILDSGRCEDIGMKHIRSESECQDYGDSKGWGYGHNNGLVYYTDGNFVRGGWVWMPSGCNKNPTREAVFFNGAPTDHPCGHNGHPCVCVPDTEMAYKGVGHCDPDSGYYAGWDGDGIGSQDACNQLCLTEPQCTYASFYAGQTCSRYSGDSCTLYSDTEAAANHITYAKQSSSRVDISVISANGRLAQMIPYSALTIGEDAFFDRTYQFTNLGQCESECFYLKGSMEEKRTPSNDVQWTIDVPFDCVVYLDFLGGDQDVNQGYPIA